jgi:hypothetical protein
VIELEVEGEILRELPTKISERYSHANVDFQPICAITNDVGLNYDVFVNGKNYVTLSTGLIQSSKTATK